MRKLVLATFFLFGYLIFRPILSDVWYPVHDTTAITRVYLLENSLSDAGFPAIWASDLNNGQGYPLFHFYAPLITYLALVGKTLTSSYFMGVKAVLFLTSVLGMVGMYLLTRHRGRLSALLSSIAFALLPYAAVNIYVRGAYAEYLAMSLLPWVFYYWRDLSSVHRRLLAALATSLFILSHNLIPLITAPFLLVWILIHHHFNFRLLVLPIITTLLLSSFYLFPLLFERHFVMADSVARTTDYAKHFVAPTQLWNSLWGFGGSGEGTPDGMSFKIGKMHLLLASIATLFIIIKQKLRELFWVISLVVALFMTTAYSAFIWQSIPFLPIVQFPWRYLALVGFLASVLAGYFLTIIKNKYLQLFAFFFLLFTLLVLNLKLFVPQTAFPADLSIYTSESYLSTLPSIVPEYRPVWLDMQNPIMSDTELLPYTYYPTWQVKVDGKRVNTYPGADGELAFSNPTHSRDVVAKQSHTKLENISTLISLITLLTLLLYYFLPKLYVKN